MPTFLTAQQFSDWEFCPRLVQLGYSIEPASWPVRIALRRYLLMAVRRLVRGTDADTVAWDSSVAFLKEAADRGYEHAIPVQASDRNAYSLMRDYACWLEAAVHLIAECSLDLVPADPVYVGNIPVYLDCWRERDHPECGHTFRIADRVAACEPKWLELLASLDPGMLSCTVHTLILPAPVRDRLHSPLVLAYTHPLTGHMRLAQRDKEKLTFGPGWKRIARWETENSGDIASIAWPEWREGIEKDECLDRCYEEYTIDWGQRDAGVRDAIMQDAGRIARDIMAKGEKARKRELCGRCRMNGWCHGDEASRDSYRLISPPHCKAIAPAIAG